MVSSISTVPFIGTLAVKNEIADRFKIVSTNISGTITGDILSKAKVILIGETHGSEKDRKGAVAVINGFGPDNVQLLLEGNSHTEGLSQYREVENQSMLSRAESWDLHHVIAAIQELYEKKMIPLLEGGVGLLQASLVAFNTNPQQSLEQYRRFATVWLNALQKELEAEETLRIDTFHLRNVQLATHIHHSLAAGIQKVIVIAGSAHITPSPQHQNSVEYLTSTLKNVPYVILNHTASLENRGSLIPSLQEAAEKLGGALYPKDKTQKLIEEINEVLSLGVFSNAQVQTFLNRLAVPIFGFKFCTNPVYAD